MSDFNESIVREFESRREGSNYWAHVPEIHAAWRERRLLDVSPLTLEYAPSLRCNLTCGECPYRKAEVAARSPRLPRGEFAEPDDVTAATLDSAKHVLESAAEAGVRGVLWTGGKEPLTCPDVPDMVRHSAELDMVNGLYTNGINIGMHPELAERIVAPANGLVFVRVSLNFVRPETGHAFSAASPEDIEAQFNGFEAAFEARARLLPDYRALDKRPPSIQASVVCDERNVDDLPLIAKRIATIAAKYSAVYQGDDDDFVVRPLTKHCRTKGYSFKDHDDSVINRIIHECRKGDPSLGVPGGPSRQAIESAGMRCYLGFGLDAIADGKASSFEHLTEERYKSRDKCWANGLFLTVGPDESVYFCVDRNSYAKWAVGNLKAQSVAEVYHGPFRRDLLEQVHSCRCGPSVCEPTCRTVRLNGIARAIQSGELTNAEIEEIRRRSEGDRTLLLS